jgi:hypothetical protein
VPVFFLRGFLDLPALSPERDLEVTFEIFWVPVDCEDLAIFSLPATVFN